MSAGAAVESAAVGARAVRRASAAESAAAFANQQCRRLDLHSYNTANAANAYKHPDNRIRLTGQLIRPLGATAPCAPTGPASSTRRRAARGTAAPDRPPADKAVRK